MRNGRYEQKRRFSSNENNSHVRGLHSNQWEGLKNWLRSRCKLVCKTEEEIPMLDFLDLIYEPQAKAHWLSNYRYFGARWVTGRSSSLSDSITASVCPRAASISGKRTLSIYMGGNGGSSHWSPFLPEIGSGPLYRPLVFAPLDMFDDSGLPARLRPLHEKYGRHIVRCAREAEVFSMAMNSVEYLFEHAKCTRMIAHFFPEIIPHVPDSKLVYWTKTKNNSFSGRYKEDKQVLHNMADRLGPNWETYKKFIVGLIVRASVVEAVNQERRTDPVDKWTEYGWYATPEDSGKPTEEWLVRLVFFP